MRYVTVFKMRQANSLFGNAFVHQGQKGEIDEQI